jgi:hypothetical protein
MVELPSISLEIQHGEIARAQPLGQSTRRGLISNGGQIEMLGATAAEGGRNLLAASFRYVSPSLIWHRSQTDTYSSNLASCNGV